MKLSIRDFFWLLVVVGCLCGWWRAHRQTQQEQKTNEQLAKENTIWKNHANAAKSVLAERGLRLKFYEHGYILERTASTDVHITDNDEHFGLTILGDEVDEPPQ